MLSFDEREEDGITILTIIGSLDASNEDEMLAKSERLVEAKKLRFILDLAQLSHIDSAGVGTLVSLFKRVRFLEGDVKISGLGGQPFQIFKLLRLDRAFEVCASVDVALKNFAEKKPAQ